MNRDIVTDKETAGNACAVPQSELIERLGWNADKQQELEEALTALEIANMTGRHIANENAKLRKLLLEQIRVYRVDDMTWDPEAETQLIFDRMMGEP